MTPASPPSRARLALRKLHHVAKDAAFNARVSRRGKNVLVLRQHNVLEDFNDQFLAWATRFDRAAASRFVLRRVPTRIDDWRDVAVIANWVQDPVKEHYPAIYANLKAIEAQADARGVRVVNRVDAMSHSIKSRAAAILRGVGIRTPAMVPIADAAAFRRDLGGLSLPLIVREDQGHGGAIHFVASRDQLDVVPIESMSHPLAVEFIDTRDKGGLYAKYRYVAIGDGGAARHLLLTDHWEARSERRVLTDATRAAELAYLESPVPEAPLFTKAARALGLDVVAFDYGFTREGELVVWEANPSAVLLLRSQRKSLAHQAAAVERLLRAMLDFYVRLADAR